MDEPVVLRIVRPYATEHEFLAAEAWTLDAKGALLLEQPPLPAGVLVRFDVVLSNGERVVRAEGRVVKALPATAQRPAGLRVRFTRFGGPTKALIDRVVAERRQAAEAQGERAASAPPEARPAVPEQPARRPSEPYPAPAPEPRSSVRATAQAEELPRPPSSEASEPTDASALQRALRHRSVRQVEPPADRDALLERLRQRARRLSNAS